MHTYMQVLMEARRWYKRPGTGVLTLVRCHVDAGNRIQVLRKTLSALNHCTVSVSPALFILFLASLRQALSALELSVSTRILLHLHLSYT